MLFNNCHRRLHATLFGAGAFYDLDQEGKQAAMATDLQPRQHCCVATPMENGDIEFGWFSFTQVRVMPNPTSPGARVRVLFGESLGSQTLPRAVALGHPLYRQFFNVNGHFKRPSVTRPCGECTAPPGLLPG
jgi:hypothetical protein